MPVNINTMLAGSGTEVSDTVFEMVFVAPPAPGVAVSLRTDSLMRLKGVT